MPQWGLKNGLYIIKLLLYASGSHTVVWGPLTGSVRARWFPWRRYVPVLFSVWRACGHVLLSVYQERMNTSR